ncbi:MAG: hypothetical protein COC05_01110 [Gammaproteobacteria bacterium]|nr:MAG: hypothetical protein COC05_01110 [Gammaproteobacteria bacterium]
MENQSLKLALSKAVLKLLKPLVRILLRNGVSYGEFAEWAKHAFVQAANTEFAVPGRKPSVSHISALTGLTRKESKRVLELDGNGDQGVNERYNRATRVIAGWLNDTRYLNGDDQPLLLAIEGERSSFASLVRDYSGDVPVRAMLDVLSNAEAIQLEGDSVKLLKHAYLPGNDPVDILNILGTDSAELVSTIDFNLTAAPEQRRFQRKVSNVSIEASSLSEFRELSRAKAQQLLEELDIWLSQHEITKKGSHDVKQDAYVSMGIYYYDNTIS